MRPIKLFRSMMSQTVQIAPRTGVDTFNKPTYGTAVTYQAKIYYASRSLSANRSPAAQTLVAGRVMHIDSADQIIPTAQVTLSTGDVGSTENWAIHPVIKSVERLYDGKGAHSTIVHLD
jgi:hypothetical protein